MKPKQPEANRLDHSFAMQVQVNDQFTLPYHTIASLRPVGMMGLTPLRFELNRVKTCETLWYRAGHTHNTHNIYIYIIFIHFFIEYLCNSKWVVVGNKSEQQSITEQWLLTITKVGSGLKQWSMTMAKS